MLTGGPAFRATNSAQQNITTSTWTKISLQTETFDTNANFDNTTNYRFQPTVAGYYQIQGNIIFTSGTASITFASAQIYKNGSGLNDGTYAGVALTGSISAQAIDLVYLNGSTDYIELYGFVIGTSPYVAAGNGLFSATLMRS